MIGRPKQPVLLSLLADRLQCLRTENILHQLAGKRLRGSDHAFDQRTRGHKALPTVSVLSAVDQVRIEQVSTAILEPCTPDSIE